MLAAGILAAAVASGGTASAEGGTTIAVVVSEDWSELDSITLADLRKIYLGKRKQLAGAVLEPWQQRGGDAIRIAFDALVLEKPTAEIDRYWIEQALLGGAQPPRTARSPDAVLDRVRRSVGAIGYVDAASVLPSPPPGVKVLPVLVDGRPLSPGQARYPLRD